MDKIEKFILINKDRSRIKVFEPFEDVSKPSPSIDAMMISYGCIYKRSSKPVMKGSRVESIENARKEYKELLEQDWKKTSIFRNGSTQVPRTLSLVFKDKSQLSIALRNNLMGYIHCNSRT